jgi:hypothetical protein
LFEIYEIGGIPTGDPVRTTASTSWFDRQRQEPLLESWLTEDGWCPHRVAIIKDAVGSTALYYYASCLSQPFRRGDHSTCSSEGCRVNYVDRGIYRTAHVRDDCSCGHWVPDIDEITTIVNAGGTPLIAVAADGPELGVHIVEFTAVYRMSQSPILGSMDWVTQIATRFRFASFTK